MARDNERKYFNQKFEEFKKYDPQKAEELMEALNIKLIQKIKSIADYDVKPVFSDEFDKLYLSNNSKFKNSHSQKMDVYVLLKPIIDSEQKRGRSRRKTIDHLFILNPNTMIKMLPSGYIESILLQQ